jgi:hypothetical protein
MPFPNWVRRHGAFYAGQWVAIRVGTDETIDHDVDKRALRLRLDAAGESGFYMSRVPERKRP